jgi:hypothetical protein
MTLIAPDAPSVRWRLGGIRGVTALLFVLLALGGCYDFHQTGPEDPAPLPRPTVVSVRVEYVQPNGCIATARPCSDLVVFFGSWMRAGGEIQLTADPGSHVWTGVVTGVPVNYPPALAPYSVRIYDPYLQDSAVVRYTGHRLKIGGELLTRIDQPGGHDENALVYIDDIGQGHNPF